VILAEWDSQAVAAGYCPVGVTSVNERRSGGGANSWPCLSLELGPDRDLPVGIALGWFSSFGLSIGDYQRVDLFLSHFGLDAAS
jgi:hypothetical protein